MVTEHVWSQEQIAAYLAGGLSSEECERLDRHARECPECAAALSAATHLDRGLGALFASVRPKPGLEDRVDDNVEFEAPLESEDLEIGTHFGIVTDIQTGPNGNLFVVSLSDGNVYEISRRGKQ